MLGTAIAAVAGAATLSTALVTTDHAALRAAPRDSAQQQALLYQGDQVEVRGERMDYLQVWDHKRERGGFVRAHQVQRTSLTPARAPELLAVLRFLRDRPGSEALGIGFAAAWLQAAPAEDLGGEAGVEAFDALGSMADRLAHRASSGAALSKAAQARLAAHLDVAARYGVGFKSYERDGRMQICYDGESFRRVLAMQAQPAQQARAALALTRQECVDPQLGALERVQMDAWRAEVLERVDSASLSGPLKNRVHMRRASIWSAVAYQRARQGQPAEAAAQRALTELAGVSKSELTDGDLATYNDAAMRTNASRWAAVPEQRINTRRPSVVTAAGESGETCVMLVDTRNGVDRPLAKRCTYSLVWANSASLNREGNALALAVQPMEAWRELWVFRKGPDGWDVSVLPPATTTPDIGYAEFAGWVPGGRQMLVAREARGDGRYKRNFEVVRLSSLSTERQASDPAILGAFQRWQDPGWKRMTVSVR